MSGFDQQLSSPVAVNDVQAMLACPSPRMDTRALRRARSKVVLMGLADRWTISLPNSSLDPRNHDAAASDADDLPLVMFAISGLEKNSSSPHVKSSVGKERSIKQIQNIASKSDANKSLILQARGVELLLDTIRNEPLEWSLAEHGFFLLTDLVAHESQAKKEIVDLDGLHLLLQYASGTFNDIQVPPALMSVVFDLLTALAQNSNTLQTSIADLGGLDTAIHALTSCSDDAVRASACRLLRYMVHSKRDRQRRLATAKGVYLLFDILRIGQTTVEIPATLHLITQGAGLLAALVADNDHLSELVGRSGGIELLVSVMEAQSRNSIILNQCCAAFRFLAFSEENRPKMGQQALVCIAKAIVTMQQNPSFVENGLLALSNATFEASDNKYLAGISGGVDATVCVMKMHLDCTALLEAGCRLLRNLAEWLATTCYQLVQDALDMILDVMEEHSTHQGIQEHACGVLVNLLQLGVMDVVNPKTENLVDTCIEVFSKDDLVRDQALELHHLILESKYKASLKESPGTVFPNQIRL